MIHGQFFFTSVEGIIDIRNGTKPILSTRSIESISKYRYRQKIRYRYQVVFDTISMHFQYFTCTFIITLSCKGIQREHNNLI